MEWFIKLHRKLLEWEWYDDTNTKVLFLHLLLTANHAPGNWRGIEVMEWETITWTLSLAKETWLSIQQIRTALKKLKSTNEITIKSTNSFSIIKLTNWESYQWSNKQTNKRTTNEQQTSNKQATTNKNEKNNKEEKEEKEIYRQFQHLTLYQEEFEKLNKNFSKEKIDTILDKIQNYKKNTNYVSLYLTALNWIKLEEEKKVPAAKINKSDPKDFLEWL